jgi:nitrogen fixation protein NifB
MKSMDTVNSPCFNPDTRGALSKIHLPVAGISFAKTKYEVSQPKGKVVMPEYAFNLLENFIKSSSLPKMVSISGPGDPMADPVKTLKTLSLVRESHSDIPLCITTLGFNIEDWIDELKKMDLSHVTIFMEAATAATAEKVYAWIRPGRKNLSITKGAELLVAAQESAVRKLKEAGIKVKVNTILYPETFEEIEAIAEKAAEYGADIMSIIPWKAEDEEADCGTERLNKATELAEKFIELVPAPQGCENDLDFSSEKAAMPTPSASRPNVAVVSYGGMELDLHLGHATKVMIYGKREDGLPCLKEVREAPKPGGGEKRWEDMASILDDCFVLLAAAAGEKPREILDRSGLAVMTFQSEVEGAVDVLFGGGKKGKCKK